MKTRKRKIFSAKSAGPAILRAHAWQTICRHMDGFALAPTLAALLRRDWFRPLLIERTVPMGVLLERTPGNPGYMHVAAKALALQGWLTLSGPAATDALQLALTPHGHSMLAFARRYLDIAGPLGSGWHPENVTEGGIDDKTMGMLLNALPAQRQSLDCATSSASNWFCDQLDGLFFVPFFSLLSAHDAVTPTRTGQFRLRLDRMGLPPLLRRTVMTLLRNRGWICSSAGSLTLTALGQTAWPMQSVYRYPFMYAALLNAADTLLFGNCHIFDHAQASETETHVDRDADIRFSGQVFSGACRQLFFERLLPLFIVGNLRSQPHGLVDVGAGDGTLLRETYNAIRSGTSRGQHLDRYPLLCVAVEYNRQAQKAAAAALTRHHIPGFAIFGDIDDPRSIARELLARGLDLKRMLVISKSVIHNRRYRPSKRSTTVTACASSFATGVDDTGGPIPPSAIARNLTEHFQRWHPWIGRFGMLVIEAHTIRPSEAAPCAGRSLATVLELTHGYSRQLLVESDIFNQASEAAALRIEQQTILGQSSAGYDYLTVSHFRTR